jgi:adenylate cyclase
MPGAACRARGATRDATGAVAFTDVVGFAAFTARFGDAHAVAVVELHDRIVRAAVGDRGRVVKQLGDGMLLWFPDDARAAVDACVTAVAEFTRATGGRPSLRAGIHWGTPVARRADLVGNAVNVAARLVDVAAPGEVVCSVDAWRAARRRAPGEGGPVTLVALAGIPLPVGVVRVGGG